LTYVRAVDPIPVEGEPDAEPLPRRHQPPRPRPGRIMEVEVSVGADAYLDLEKKAHAVLARE
jgi:hypothetical protein